MVLVDNTPYITCGTAVTYGTGTFKSSIIYNTGTYNTTNTTTCGFVGRWATVNNWDTLNLTYTTQHDNGAADTSWTYGAGGLAVYPPHKSSAERLREILNNRMAPGILSVKSLGYTQDVREMRARETLRRVIGEDKFRDFVRKGSVSVRAKSGLMYQIFPGSNFTKVYDRGKLIEQLCVVLMGGFPPTDSLIMRYLLLLNNESFFRSKAIKHSVHTPIVAKESDQRSLVEIFKELKHAA